MKDSNGIIILKLFKPPQISNETPQEMEQTGQNLNNIDNNRSQNYPKLEVNIWKGSTQNILSGERVIDKENKNIKINGMEIKVHNPVIIPNNESYGQPSAIPNTQDNNNSGLIR